jgi:hypothetical protein
MKYCYRIAAIQRKILKNQWLHYFLSMGEAWLRQLFISPKSSALLAHELIFCPSFPEVAHCKKTEAGS